MSSNPQQAHREHAATKPRPVESVVGNTMQKVAAAMIVLGAAEFVVALSRGASAIAWQAYLVNLLFFLGVAQGAVVASAAFYLTQAKVGRLDAVSAGRGVRAVSVGGIFSFLRTVLWPQPDFSVGDASDSAEGGMAERPVSVRA